MFSLVMAKMEKSKPTEDAEQTPLHTNKRSSGTFGRIREGDVGCRSPDDICRDAQKSSCGDRKPFDDEDIKMEDTNAQYHNEPT
ncbi:MAG: hypothetical protein Q9210_002325 [Variospora velana]